tara:strand:- start:22064 stop:22642 length:579 start_codon:yes stop_codon:yes gene_type:complete
MKNEIQDILDELRAIKNFPSTNPKRDKTRMKVCLDPTQKIEAFCLGKARAYHLKKLTNCAKNKRFSKLLEVCDIAVKKFDPNFQYTTIQINKNVKCAPHTDRNNAGVSVAISLGDFTGGGIIQYNTDGSEEFIDTKNCFKYQDGNIKHTTAPFEGERYALIFFYHQFGCHPRGDVKKEDLIAYRDKVLTHTQ